MNDGLTWLESAVAVVALLMIGAVLWQTRTVPLDPLAAMLGN